MQSSQNEETYRRCPQCGATVFWNEKPGSSDEMVFIRVRKDGTPVVRRANHSVTEWQPLPELHCVSCSWSGGIDELYLPMNSP